jgi:hypothetical protein
MTTYMEVEVQLHCLPQHSNHFTSVERALYTLNRKLYGPQSQAGYFGEEEISPIAARKQTLDPPA